MGGSAPGLGCVIMFELSDFLVLFWVALSARRAWETIPLALGCRSIWCLYVSFAAPSPGRGV